MKLGLTSTSSLYLSYTHFKWCSGHAGRTWRQVVFDILKDGTRTGTGEKRWCSSYQGGRYTWWSGHRVLLGRYKKMVRWTDTLVLVVTLENPDQ